MYSKEKQQEHISRIRRVLVINPNITNAGIQAKLEKSEKRPIHLDKDYIAKLTNRIRRERAKRFNNYTIDKVLTKFQDEVEESKKNLWVIINSGEENNRISAIRELRNSSRDLFDKMFDAGVFERKIGEIKIKEKTLEELLKNADEKTKKQLSDLAKEIISDKREGAEGDSLPK